VNSGEGPGDVTLVFGWELVPYEPIVIESGPKGGCTVGFNNVLDEPFFNLNPVE